MLTQLLFYSRIFLLPIGAYLAALFLVRLLKSNRLIRRLRVPLHIALFLGTLLSIYVLSGAARDVTAFKLLKLLLWLDLVYLGVRVFEYSFLEEMLERRQLQVPMFFRDIARALILVFALTVLLKLIFDVEPSGLLVTSTVLSAIIGLALQETLSNIFSGAALQMEKPFQVGDWVFINEREGRIVEMSWRTTKIRNRDNDIIIMPNTEVAKHDILNYHEPNRLHRVRERIGTSYDDPPEQVKRALLEIVADVPEIKSEPKPDVLLLGYGDFSIDYELRYWIEAYERLPYIRDMVTSKIWYRFRREGITIPFPIRTVTMETIEHVEERHARDHAIRREEIAAMMAETDILAPFDTEILASLSARAVQSAYAEGEHLVRQGDRDSSFYIIVSGKVSVVTSADGREKLIGTFGPGYFFGEGALLTGEARTASVIAAEETIAVVIEKDDFRPVLEARPETAVTLSKILEQRSIELERARDTITISKNRKHTEHATETSSSLLNRIQRFFNL